MRRTFYRLVETDPPTRDDFLSYEALGEPLHDESQRALWSGVSVQATEQQARNRAKLRGFGRHRYIAELSVDDTAAIIWQRTGTSRGTIRFRVTPMSYSVALSERSKFELSTGVRHVNRV